MLLLILKKVFFLTVSVQLIPCLTMILKKREEFRPDYIKLPKGSGVKKLENKNQFLRHCRSQRSDHFKIFQTNPPERKEKSGIHKKKKNNKKSETRKPGTEGGPLLNQTSSYNKLMQKYGPRLWPDFIFFLFQSQWNSTLNRKIFHKKL